MPSSDKSSPQNEDNLYPQCDYAPQALLKANACGKTCAAAQEVVETVQKGSRE